MKKLAVLYSQSKRLTAQGFMYGWPKSSIEFLIRKETLTEFVQGKICTEGLLFRKIYG